MWIFERFLISSLGIVSRLGFVREFLIRRNNRLTITGGSLKAELAGGAGILSLKRIRYPK
jgi:hypothetical protein